jgi:hypothetical protein
MKLNKIKRITISIAISSIMFASLATVAFADGGGYGSQPGYPVANGNTICAGHGAFGAFSGTANDGQQGSEVHGFVLADKAAGISLGSETGPANSNLCGNPQN